MKKTIFIEFVTYIFTFACFIFVMYQGCQCLSKYLAKPKSTDVTIDLASNHSYPGITICFESETDIFDSILHECNLTFNDYFVENKWIGINQSIEICRDPAKLNQKLIGLVPDAVKIDINNEISSTNESFEFKLKGQRNCVSYKMPQNTEITTLYATFHQKVHLFFGNQGDFLDTDLGENRLAILELGTSLTIDLSYEVFEFLDYNGESCAKYNQPRDDCILKNAHESSMSEIGCTSPFGANKSIICADPEKAKMAKMKLENLTYQAACPRSCKYLMTSFGTFSKYPMNITTFSMLYLKFPKFIKVSTSNWAYTMLELIAEVGGYVGLFLGVSINQFANLLKKTFNRIGN